MRRDDACTTFACTEVSIYTSLQSFFDNFHVPGGGVVDEDDVARAGRGRGAEAASIHSLRVGYPDPDLGLVESDRVTSL